MSVTLKNNHDAFMELSRNVATMYMNRSGNNFVKYEGNDFINTVGLALHLRPDESKLVEGAPGDAVFFSDDVVEKSNHILDAIREYGGNDPYMIIYPIVLETEDSKELFDDVVCLPLFRVRKNGDGKTSRYIDTNGRSYTDENDFKNNVQLPPGKMSYPKDLVFSHDSNGHAEIVYSEVNTSHTMEYVDLTVTLLCLGAGALAIFTGVGILLGVGIVAGCGVYGVTRSTQVLVDRAKHGQSINPFTNWDSFNAWAGIGANLLGLGFAANSIRLSGTISQLATEGLRISQSAQIALKAGIFVPLAINGGLMAVQFYQLAAFWDRLPVQQKIIIGLQFLFFAATTAKMRVLSVEGMEERAGNVAFKELSNHLERNSQFPSQLASSVEKAAARVGGKNYRTIDFLKKLANYKRGALINASVDEARSSRIAIEMKGNDIGLNVREKYFCGPEAAIQVFDEVDIQEAPYGPTETFIFDEFQVPLRMTTIDAILEVKRFANAAKVEEGQDWLKGQLQVSDLENYKVNGVSIFENMKYHDQVRIQIFKDIGRSLNENLIRTCLRYAAEQDVKTVGQYASEYEIFSLQIHKRANEMVKTFKKLTPAHIRQEYGINVETTTETRMSYAELPKEKANMLFAEDPHPKGLAKMKLDSINNIGGGNAAQILEGWKSSIHIPPARTIASPNADLITLANQVVNAGELSFKNSDFHTLNAANYFKLFSEVDINQYPQIFLDDVNATIQSSRVSIETRVFDATRPRDESLGIRRLVFWNLDDENYAKSVVVAIDKTTNEVRIQNASQKKVTTSITIPKNAKEAIFEHWENNFDYENFKANLRESIDAIKSQTEEYVGPQLVRSGLDHEGTVSDIQSLRSVRFASFEQAICHVLKHGENLTTNEQLAAEVRNYFNKAQDVIKSTIGHPENVSSSWTQTGSARDFFFYRKLDSVRGVEKVVVLVREGGEVIMKTYFLDERLTSIPTKKTHSYQDPVDIKHADLRTFYFQLMLMAPRYGVLLPKDYEMIESDLDSEKTRTILIMAGHYFNKDGSVNSSDLVKALNSAFPIDRISWSVVAMKVNVAYSFKVKSMVPHYMFARIKNIRFIIFAEGFSTKDDAVLKAGAKEKYGSLPNNASVQKAIGFPDPAAVDIACRICSSTTRASDIAKAMNESFGEKWNCVWVKDYDFDIYFHHCYLRVALDNGTTTCAVFR